MYRNSCVERERERGRERDGKTRTEEVRVKNIDIHQILHK
jgi:hypothetical protein